MNKNSIIFVFICIFSLPLNSQSLTITAPNGNEFWQVGKTPSITWNSTGLTSDIDLEYSTNNGNSWNFIATVLNTTNSYEWIIPNQVSTQCLIRATSNTTADDSDSVFEISNDTSTCTIVVLGSSTAAGTGATPIENSWVNLYASAIFQKNTKLTVVNLAVPGYNTYQILPTGTTIPDGETIDTNKNITKALENSPVAIIINMPSNDTADGYSATMQMENYTTLNTYATNNSVPLWIATPQPRNSFNTAEVQTQIDVKEDLLLIYNDKAINFWDGIADVDGKILASLDAGDGIHVNDEGHTILFNKVLDKNIDALTCLAGSLGLNDIKTNLNYNLKIHPNPAKDYINIDFKSEFSGELKIEFHDTLGRKLLEQHSDFNPGTNSVTVSLKQNKSASFQLIFGTLTFQSDNNIIQKSVKLILK